MDSNWTHVPFGYKNENKNSMSRVTANSKDSLDREAYLIDHVLVENSELRDNIKEQEHLIFNLIELIDMFATGNVDLSFYKKVQKDYSKLFI